VDSSIDKRIIILPNTSSRHIPKVKHLLNGPEHWTTWSGRLKWYFKSHEVEGYVDSTIRCPDPKSDPTSTRNWRKNDAHACSIIVSNIAESQLIHTNRCNTSHKMWEALRSVHEQHGHQTTMNLIRVLFKTSASEDADITQHLNKIKSIWECINVLSGEHFKFSGQFFKLVVASSLPASWDIFTDPYMGSETGIYSLDSRRNMSSQEFLGVIISEYQHRQSRSEDHLHDGTYAETSNIATSRG
jgi:gag-polypeptide of LTR copia-type